MSHIRTSHRRLSKVTGIDAKTVATTNLYTVPIGHAVIVTMAMVTTEDANTVTQRPVMGIGIAAGEDDIYSSRALTGFTASDSIYIFQNVAKYVQAESGDVIKLGIDNGSSATTHTITVELYGYFI